MSTTTTFRTSRRLDREVIESLHRIAQQTQLVKPKLRFLPFEGAPTREIPCDQFEKDEILQEVLPHNEAALVWLAVVDGRRNRQLLTVRRVGNEYFDKVEVDFDAGEPRLSDVEFVKLLATAKKELQEVRIDGSLAGFGNKEIDRYYEARDATLTRLETVTTQVLFQMQERQKQLDIEFQKRLEQLESKLAGERESLKKEFEQKDMTLHAREEAIKTREAEFETHESKYLRRQLRMDMLKKLEELSKKFQLTQGTRRLRWPIAVFIIVFLGFCGTMTALVYLQTAHLLEAFGQDISRLQWWQWIFLGIKQLGFLAAFLAGAWFFVKWNDRWFRQHADAEFMFKQLELDINRASWVVEMALEWTKEKGTEIPAELLDHLARNLFHRPNQTNEDVCEPTDLASLILGAAASVKMKTPGGAEIEFDHKGLKKALKQASEE
jgi:hypothetical protein